MMNFKKTVSAIALLLVISLMFVSCGPAFRDDVASDTITSAAEPLISTREDLDPADESYIGIQQKLPIELCIDYSEYFQTSGVGIDEFGVFRMKDEESVKTMIAAVNAYIETAKEAFVESYAPGEFPKLENASVKQYGNYVVYAVLSDSDKTALFDTVEKALKK